VSPKQGVKVKETIKPDHQAIKKETTRDNREKKISEGHFFLGFPNLCHAKSNKT
jgi:hypothetical protein